jgi:hypothetical protein
MAAQTISTQTPGHTITIADEKLTIKGDSETFSPEEMQQLLEVLLIWQYGLEVNDDEN